MKKPAFLDGPTVATASIMLIVTAVVPSAFDLFTVLQITSLSILAILALSLALSFGLGGILCFGQAAFFGLGAYAYAIATISLGESSLGIVLAIAVPTAVALALGWFMFMGRLSSLYVGVVTLCVTLILFNLVNSTADPWYRIAGVPLNGFNGISAVPTINIPFVPDAWLTPNQMFVLSSISLLAVYLMCKVVAASAWGRVVSATRQNELRAELLGYRTARVKLGIFVLGSAVAGFAGCLFTSWNGYVSPNVFSLSMTAQIIIWIIVGGRSTFVGPVIGAIALQFLTTRLGNSGLDARIILGAILMAVVVLLPKGLVPGVGSIVGSVLDRWRGAERGSLVRETVK